MALEIHQRPEAANGRTISEPCLAKLALQIAASHTWNKETPREHLYTVHELIKERTLRQPLADAVNSWDGNLTYRELDELSDSLVPKLHKATVKAGTVVPMCFEKSKWTIVAILAVMKIGAAFLLLDPSHPAARLEYMIKTVNASVVLSSPQHSQHEALKELRGIVVDESSIDIANRHGSDGSYPKGDARAALYVMFTSGTTDAPKGFTIEHRAFCSSALARASIIQRDERSRVFQFAAFTFDPCMEDMLTTLMVGGCICIPNENQRINDLAKCIRDLDANFLNVTPGVSDLLEPQEVPGLKILLLSGESMKARHIEKWSPHLQLINGYDPSECCLKCAINPGMVPGMKPTNIGFPVGSSLWVVNPSNIEDILPVGEEGELLIEGPTLARGYLQDNATKSFVEAPSWLKLFRNDPAARIYKTGDLAMYREDGSIDFIGRRDTQAKINGQRIEFGEIESLISKVTSQEYQAIVEFIPLKDEERPTLVASVYHAEAPKSTGARSIRGNYVGRFTPEFAELAANLSRELAAWLPRYMIPSLFLPIQAAPLTVHGKTDRRVLKCELLQIERKLIIPATQGADDAAEDCLDPQEWTLLQLWDGAVVATPFKSKHGADSIAQFSLLDGGELKGVLNIALEQASLTSSEIEDIYPCTPLQSYWAEYALAHPGELQALWIYSVPPKIEITKLQNAWEKVMAEIPTLGARVIKLPGRRFIQVISNDKRVCEKWTSLQGFMENKTPLGFRLGQPLTSAAVILDCDSNQQYFGVISHHSAWDGWSKKLLFARLGEIYLAPESPSPEWTPFTRLIEQIQTTSTDRYHEFWKTELSGVTQTALFFRKQVDEPARAKSYSFEISFPATDLGIEDIVAPTAAQVPLRILIKKEQAVTSWLEGIQNQLVKSIPYMHADWDIFRSQLGEDVHQAWESSPLLVIHPVASRKVDEDCLPLGMKQVERLFARKIPFTVECYVSSETIKTDIFYDETIFSPSVVSALC
ncbi:hypothetical protein MGYG_03469 [Nannizzia gypsea CBS 118893]|uniref:HC-toxin synthetase n=1 Tax=Arthroderma gypseum (strain ATCC MYA-4604 / CBS 118893) TaxID=535722 RepID=E4US49_ARTGP|nr:hypothetical protein MGYG_03469 [Nannizzia gypsea CBS 118893]EFR00467.1 hypothetical protein MGYG_03469 [Nannizzia gypsea CBS 118893]